MGRTALKYGAGLIALYLVVFNGSKSGTVFKQGAAGSVSLVKAFQGR
jgi:hypothetical protein